MALSYKALQITCYKFVYCRVVLRSTSWSQKNGIVSEGVSAVLLFLAGNRAHTKKLIVFVRVREPSTSSYQICWASFFRINIFLLSVLLKPPTLAKQELELVQNFLQRSSNFTGGSLLLGLAQGGACFSADNQEPPALCPSVVRRPLNYYI